MHFNFSSIKKKDNKEIEQPGEPIIPQNPFSPITPVYPKGNQKLEAEFVFKTKVGDLRRIYVNQKYQEDRLFEGEKITRIKERITNYDIYIMSETEPTKDFENFYEKIYTVAISIVSECFVSDNEICEPQKLVDLTDQKLADTEESNFEVPENLKDIPIPICLFNLTNNDVITSITCPE